MPMLVLITMSLLSLVTMGLSVRHLRSNLRLLREGRRVPGEVVDAIRSRTSQGPASMTPVVRYRTPHGDELVSSPGRRTQFFTRIPPGPVTVVYDEARPKRILVEFVDDAPSRTGFISMFVVYMAAAVAIAVVGVVVYAVLR